MGKRDDHVRRVFLAALAPLLLQVIPAQADVLDPVGTYRSCLLLAKKNPEEGWEQAIAWQSLGGGEPARHCAGVALIGLGKYGEAATRLENLANESVRDDRVRSEMFAQAGQAWVLAGNLPRADSAQRAALTLSPGNTDVMLDQAVLFSQLGQFPKVVDILTQVLRLQPGRIEALALRAAAFRYQDNLYGAMDDVARALEMDPDYPEALLERGMIWRLKGDDAAARADWMKAISLVPDTPLADTARRNLELMDVKMR